MSMGMRSTHFRQVSRKQPYSVIIIHNYTIYHRIYNIRKTHCSVGITVYEYLHNYYNYCLTRHRLMAENLALSATQRLANRVSLCSELSAARRSLRRSVLPSECAAYLALSATRRFANRVSLSSELSAARRSLLLLSLASSLV